jgi:predicted CXXCH cytochrome family protein
MLPRRISIAMVAVAVLSLAGAERAAGVTEPGPGGVPLPVIPKGQGEACVADTEFMRRNHMTMLKHQRDETMRQGIRGNPYSLGECVACHAVAGPDGVPLTVSSPQHFCRNCHDYAAVSIDCFQCHASRPEPGLAVSDADRTGGAGPAGMAQK